MPTVYLGVGSNTEPASNLRLAISELSSRFDLKAVSPVYRNKPVGFEGDDFLNAVVCVETTRSPAETEEELEAIHALAGRERGADRFVARTLDIDLLLYGQEIIESRRVPREDILLYSFVLRPLADIAPDVLHPVTRRTISWHWQRYDAGSHPLSPEPLILSNQPQRKAKKQRRVTPNRVLPRQ